MAAAREGRIRELPGMGEKTEQAILAGAEVRRARGRRARLGRTLRPFAENVSRRAARGAGRRALRDRGQPPPVRRHRQGHRPGRLDRRAGRGGGRLRRLRLGGRGRVRGETKVTCIAHDGTRVELRMVEPGAFGNLLQHLTGSKDHNVALREDAVRARPQGQRVRHRGGRDRRAAADRRRARGLRAAGHGLDPARAAREPGRDRGGANGDAPGAGRGRADPRRPALRTPTGATARRRSRRWSPPRRAWATATSTSPTTRRRSGSGWAWTPAACGRRSSACGRWPRRCAPDFVLLVGCEVDILRDGSLDYSDALLEELDVVVASVHASHRLSAADQTKRICTAMENPHVDILGHPTGRLIGRREPNPLDIEAVVETAVRTGTVLEVSAQPDRLDLSRRPRPAGDRGGRQAVDRHRRPQRRAAGDSALRRDERAARLGHRRRRRQHARVAAS